jgi:hypothetical protein
MFLSETVALLEIKDGVLILDGDSWEVTEGGHTGILLSEATAVLTEVVSAENCLCRLGTGDAIDRVGVAAPVDGPGKERTGDGLLLERVMMLASENASCRLICFTNAKLSSKDNWHSGQRGCLSDSR